MSDSEMGSDEAVAVDCVVRRGRGSGRDATQETEGHRHVTGERTARPPRASRTVHPLVVHSFLSESYLSNSTEE